MKKRKLSRHELKHLWFNLDYSNVKERKEIIVVMNKGPHWPGYGTIEILSEGIGGYTSFKTFQEFPMKYLETREEYKSGKYKLIIK
tara:strand:+ start:241 stop:498 length:258 start_codon:yes stop_codon:yes gene_type:complete